MRIRRDRLGCVVGALAIVVALGLEARAGDIDATDVAPSHAIIKLKSGHDIADIDRDYGTQAVGSIPRARLHLLLLPAHWDEEDFRDLIEEDSRVEDAQLDYCADVAGGETQGFFYDAVPEDRARQHAWTIINLPGAQGVSRGAGVVVAILDTGYDPHHPALAAYDVVPGYDFVDRDDEPWDVPNHRDDDGDEEIDELTGHGTFVLGVVAAVAPEATFLPIRVLDSDGQGQIFHLAEAIDYAVAQGADVVNISIGTPRKIEFLKKAIEEAHDAGVVLVSAAGNTGRKDPKRYPSAYGKAIAVTATDELDRKLSIGNWGKHVDVSAPGKDIVSIAPNDRFARASGTSLSTALVTGVAALVRSRDPEMEPNDVEKALEENAVDVDRLNPDYKDHMGKGRLDALAALDLDRPDGDDADLNDDGRVDDADIILLLAAWGPCPPGDACRADLDANGTVDTIDLIMLLGEWD